jgi:hypothetical protein
VQGTQAHKLLPGTASARLPVMPLQIFQHWQVLFELFQIRVHGSRSSQNRGYEESVRFPRQGWWVEEFLRDAVAKAVVEKERA